jgi:GNAT superfamily N-acetyltransferase
MVLGKGVLVKNKHKEDMQLEEYKMKLIDKNRLREVVELQHYVYENLPNKEVLYIDSYEDMLGDLENGAKIIGVLNSKDRLIAYRYISFPREEKRNLGYDINLPEEDLKKVVHLETTVVDPLYRGNGLQLVTLEKAKEIAKQEGYKHFMCTVSPYNFYSLYNVMRGGLKIKALKKKYGTKPDNSDGLWRFILHNDLDKKYYNPVDLVLSKWANLEMQKSLIDQGYIGYEIIKDTKELSYIKVDEAYA